MSNAGSGGLGRDSLRAARGVLRLISFRADWVEDFDLTMLGFVRSFFAQFLRAPLIILFACAMARATGDEVTRALILQTAAALAISVVGYTLVTAGAARLAGLAGWRAFIVLVNWGDLFFATMMTAVASLTVLGENGGIAVQLIWLMLAAPVQILFLWRASRTVLQADVAATVLLIVLNIATSVAADQLASVLIPT
jgi:hypothetical protein